MFCLAKGVRDIPGAGGLMTLQKTRVTTCVITLCPVRHHALAQEGDSHSQKNVPGRLHKQGKHIPQTERKEHREAWAI